MSARFRVPDWFVGRVVEPVWDLYERSVRLHTYRRLELDQFDSPRALADRRAERLNLIVRHAAATSPFYRRRFDAAGIDPAAVRSMSDLATLPLLTKIDVREHSDEIISDRYRRCDLVPAKTGGSTGVALHVFCDARGVEQRNGAALLADTWSGWRLGQSLAAIWGNPPEPVSLRNRLRRALKDRIIFLDTMKLDESAVRVFAEQWRGAKPGLLFGHAHSIFLLAEMIEAMGVVLRPDGIVATSMMLLQPEREVIERVFERPVTNRYGCEEVSLIACECERHAGLHINAEHVAVEILRDDGTPCAPGEDGRLVITEFVNFGMPMLRYEVGDRGVWHDRTCACGRPHPLLRAVTGRVADFLAAADGSRVAGISLIENTLTRYPGIGQLQVVQDEVSRLTVNLVRADGWRDETIDALTVFFRDALGAELRLDVVYVDRIPREANGKYRFSICRVGADPAP
jgi:phenylacetate-CoA ligase